MEHGPALAAAGVLVTAGSALIAVGSNSTPEISGRPWIRLTSVVIGVGCIALGMAIVAVAFAPRVRASAIDCEYARRRDLKMLHDFAKSYFPTVSLNQTKALYRLNRRMIWMLISRRRRLFGLEFGSRLLGYFTVVPLDGAAIPLLDQDGFESEHFSKDYVTKEGGTPSAVYIGSIAARRGVGAHALMRLAFIVGEYRTTGYPVYTRPMTRTGLRLMGEWGFQPVATPGMKHIYRLDEQEAEEFEIERARRILDQKVVVGSIPDQPSRKEVLELIGEEESDDT